MAEVGFEKEEEGSMSLVACVEDDGVEAESTDSVLVAIERVRMPIDRDLEIEDDASQRGSNLWVRRCAAIAYCCMFNNANARIKVSWTFRDRSLIGLNLSPTSSIS
jgi:hypothetical protein